MMRLTQAMMPFRSASLMAFAMLLASHGLLMAVPMRFLPWDYETAARKIGLQNGKAVIELHDLHPHKRSKVVQASGDEASPLMLVAMDRNDAKGKPLMVEIKLPAGAQSPLVLIMPDPASPSGLRPFVIEDNASNFPWGSVRLFNATAQELLLRHEKTIVSLAKAWTPVDVSPGGEARNVSVQVVARAKPDVLLYSAVWEQDPDIRKLVFIVPSPSGEEGEMEFKIIPENRRTAVLETPEKPAN